MSSCNEQESENIEENSKPLYMSEVSEDITIYMITNVAQILERGDDFNDKEEWR